MSYARFSSDDHRSDVYVYKNRRGAFVIHVAAQSPVISEEQYASLPPKPATVSSPEGFEAFVRRSQAMTRLVMGCENWIAYTHPLAGEDFHFDTAAETADQLEKLQKEGFWVPEDALTRLREDALEDAESKSA